MFPFAFKVLFFLKFEIVPMNNRFECSYKVTFTLIFETRSVKILWKDESAEIFNPFKISDTVALHVIPDLGDCMPPSCSSRIYT